MDSTIIGAIIGAFATILAALISKDYAERRIDATEPTMPLDAPTKRIVRALSALTVQSVRIIRLKNKQVYVDDELGVVLLLETAWIETADIKITYFDGSTGQIHFPLGTVLNFEARGSEYYMILTKVDIHEQRVEIQVRKKPHAP